MSVGWKARVGEKKPHDTGQPKGRLRLVENGVKDNGQLSIGEL